MKRCLQILFAVVVVTQAAVVFLLMGDLLKRDRRIDRLEQSLAAQQAAKTRVLSHSAASSDARTDAVEFAGVDPKTLIIMVNQQKDELQNASEMIVQLSQQLKQVSNRQRATQPSADQIAVMEAHTKSMRLAERKGRGWGPEQATGAPDTETHNDMATAWAPKQQNGGEEWLEVDYEKAVTLSEINVHETYNPGAISKVTAMLPDGQEEVIWEGTVEPGDDGDAPERVESSFTAEQEISANRIKVYLDTTRVSGWNEIDAVEMVGRDGSRQWASDTRASSSYADQ